jgi:hypothetical protein
VRTALCVEPRDGILNVFMPPLTSTEDYLELVAAVEEAARAHDTPVRIDGYAPPRDPRIGQLAVTPDPGVIEVNALSWKDILENTTALYEDARLTRLGTEKFMIDGRAHDERPRNALEAEGRRSSRFFAFGHTPGRAARDRLGARPARGARVSVDVGPEALRPAQRTGFVAEGIVIAISLSLFGAGAAPTFPSARARARASLHRVASAGSDVISTLMWTTSSMGVVRSDGRRLSYRDCVILASAGRAAGSQPSSVANELKNSPPPAAMSRVKSRKLTSAKAACSRSATTTPPETQFDVPDVMPKVWLADVPLVVAARICASGVFTGPNTSEPRPHPAIP